MANLTAHGSFAILAVNWALSVMTSRDGFRGARPDQILKRPQSIQMTPERLVVLVGIR